MRIEVLFFASARDLAGTDQKSVELPDGADVASLLRRVLDEHPALEGAMRSARFARNEDFVERDAVLADGDRVAWLPPMSGG
jgi:molybdopterin converting factor subunit 1